MQNWSVTELIAGQGIGVDKPKAQALLHISGGGLEQEGIVPVQGGGAPHVAQLKVASQPE